MTVLSNKYLIFSGWNSGNFKGTTDKPH